MLLPSHAALAGQGLHVLSLGLKLQPGTDTHHTALLMQRARHSITHTSTACSAAKFVCYDTHARGDAVLTLESTSIAALPPLYAS
jgi:hypothetical protein